MVFVVQFTNEADKIGGERAAGLINGMKPSFILEDHTDIVYVRLLISAGKSHYICYLRQYTTRHPADCFLALPSRWLERSSHLTG
jgi:hypothetical protein